MGLYRSLLVLTDSNGAFLVLISPFSSLWILFGPYESL